LPKRKITNSTGKRLTKKVVAPSGLNGDQKTGISSGGKGNRDKIAGGPAGFISTHSEKKTKDNLCIQWGRKEKGVRLRGNRRLSGRDSLRHY